MLKLPQNKISGLLMVISWLFVMSCSKKNNTHSRATQKSEAPGMTSSEVMAGVEVDEAGNVKSLPGLSFSQLINKNQTVTLQEITDNPDQALFSFIPPIDSTVEFSQPQMVTAAYLAMVDFRSACEGLTYRSGIPTMASLKMGFYSYYICIKISSSEQTVFLKTPPVALVNADGSQPAASRLSQASIVIAAGALYSNDLLVALSLEASGAKEMYLSEFAGCDEGGQWQPFVAEKTWRLSKPNAINVVYGKFRDEAGGEGPCLRAEIIHDDQAPTNGQIIINNGALATASADVIVSLAAESASDMYMTGTPGCLSGGSWTPFATEKAWTLSATQGPQNIMVKFRDQAGNESACYSDAILRLGSDTGASLMINAGASYTSNQQVSLALSANAASDMYITNTVDCGAASGSWEPYLPTKTWTLDRRNAGNMVYAKFRYPNGQHSSCLSAAIIHDDTPPGAPSLGINSGASATKLAVVNLSLAATEASHMYVTNTPGCSAGGSWQTFATQRAWTLAQRNAPATVYAKFRDASGNETACLSAAIIHDDTPPSAASISINSGALLTSSSVASLTLTATGASDMYVTNNASCTSGGVWETMASAKAWSLSPNAGQAQVYARFRDEAGNLSICVSAAIAYDDQAPTSTSIGINGGAAYVTTSAVMLSLGAIGATEMLVTNTPACAGGGSWEAHVTSKAWTLAQTNATAIVYAKFRDAAGNESACISDSVIHDNEAPSGASLTINGGASVTSVTAVNLSLSASQVAAMYITNTAGCLSGGSWQSYVSSAPWTLAQSEATATVYGKFRDEAGNETACVNDTITHDSTSPMAPSLVIAAGAAATNAASVTLTLAATAATDMYITNTNGCSADGSWEPYSASKSGWVLASANALNTVYAKFRSSGGGESPCVASTIVHDDTLPANPSLTINGGSSYTADTAVTLTLSVVDASAMYITNTGGCGSGGTWEAYTISKAWTLGVSDQMADVYVKFRDAALNESSCVSASITHDSQPPAAPNLSINAGAVYTSTPVVTLTTSASGASDMYVTNTAACASGGSWEPLASSRAWMLAQTNATATVYVKYRDEAGNTTVCVSDTIIHDDSSPSGGSLSIAGGSTYTTTNAVTLGLAATSASAMYITNAAACNGGGSWETYASSKAWNLGQANSVATVYAKFRNSAGNESSCVSGSVIHDDTAPAGPTLSINAGSAYTNVTAVGLSLSAGGASEMYVTDTSGCGSGGGWEAYAASKSWSLAQTNSLVPVYAKFKDPAGNETTCISASIIHDNIAPLNPTISIYYDYTYVTSASTYLTLSAGGANEMYITNTAGCGAGGSWIGYATGANWTLGQTNSTATVYVKYRDPAGNESSCVNDTIIHDDIPPTVPPTMHIDRGNTTRNPKQTPHMVWGGGSTDAGSGFYRYVVSVGSTLGGSDVTYIYTTSGCCAIASASDLFTWGGLYYVSIYAVDNAGNYSARNQSLDENFIYGWRQHSYLKAPNADAADGFGKSVALTGDVLVVGAPGEASAQTTISVGASSDNSAPNAGAAYVFTRVYSTWTQQAYLKAANAHAGDRFGHTLAISSDTVAIGAYNEASAQTTITNGSTASGDTSAADSGAVYMFKRNGAAWSQEAYVKAANAEAGARFGKYVALDTDTLVVGAPAEASNQTTITNGTTASTDITAPSSGAVYVYARSAASWTQQAYLKASNAEASDAFGSAVGISSNVIAVAAPAEASNVTTITNGTTASADNSSAGTGAVYVYSRSGTTWTQEAYLKAANAEAGDSFGSAVSLSANTLAVGAAGEDSHVTLITNGSTASTSNTAAGAGAVYVYVRSGTTWGQQAYLKAANTDAGDGFGSLVSLEADTLAVTALGESSATTTFINGTTASTDNSSSGRGAVYLYKRTGSTWAQQAYLKSSEGIANYKFGSGIAVSGTTVAVGVEGDGSAQTTITSGFTASSDDSAAGAGSVYIFQ